MRWPSQHGNRRRRGHRLFGVNGHLRGPVNVSVARCVGVGFENAEDGRNCVPGLAQRYPGLEDKEEIERALALGASHFFAKPHNLEGYKEVVRAVWEVGIKSSATEGNQARRRSEGCPRRDGWGKAPPATVF